MYRVPTLFRLSSRRSQGGVTLVEMMVAVTVGLILLAGIIQLFSTNKKAYRLQEGTNVLNENARYLLSQFEYDVRMAGHWAGVVRGGGAGATSQVGVLVVGTAPASDCTQSPALSLKTTPGQAAYGIEGFDGSSAPPLSCIPAADYVSTPRTDVLILRYGGAARVDDATVTSAANANAQFVRTGSDQIAEIFDGKDFTARYNSGGTGALRVDTAGFVHEINATYPYNALYYFIRKCASQDKGTVGVCDGQDDTTPTLTRLALRSGALVQEDVMAGVEQFQVTYGVDSSPTNDNPAPSQFQNATAVTAANAWDNVSEVRVSFVLRNTESDPTYTDTSTYFLYGGNNGATTSYTPPLSVRHFHRKVFNSSIQMRNLNLARVR